MTINESTIDRGIRIVVGLLLLFLGFGGYVTGTAGTVLKVLGFIPLLTGLIGFCPLYTLFKIKTNR